MTVIVSSSVNVDIRVMHSSRGHAVDLRRARAALARLAVPADGEVGRLGGLQPVDDVEDDLALVDLDREVLQLAAVDVAPPDPELRCRTPLTRSAPLSARYFGQLAPRSKYGLAGRRRMARTSSNRSRQIWPASAAGSALEPVAVVVERADQVDLAPLAVHRRDSPRGCGRRGSPALQRRLGDALARPAACCAGRAPGASPGCTAGAPRTATFATRSCSSASFSSACSHLARPCG